MLKKENNDAGDITSLLIMPRSVRMKPQLEVEQFLTLFPTLILLRIYKYVVGRNPVGSRPWVVC